MRFFIPIVAMLACNAAAAAGNAEQGRATFVKHGCYQCHGFAGQGGSNGKTLAPNPLPYEAFSVFVRNTNGQMPPYQKAILSDDELADIYAYLRTVKAPDYKTLPLP